MNPLLYVIMIKNIKIKDINNIRDDETY